MAAVQAAMIGRLLYTSLRDAIWTHPTAAEGLIGLFANPPASPKSNKAVSSDIESTGGKRQKSVQR
jgi:hypothetical protein